MFDLAVDITGTDVPPLEMKREIVSAIAAAKKNNCRREMQVPVDQEHQPQANRKSYILIIEKRLQCLL